MTALYDKLRLRTSDVLGDFSEVFSLPHCYGDLRKSKIRLGKLSETLYFVADHPMLDITAVDISGTSTKDWRWFTKADKDNVTSTFVELGSPADRIGAIVTASGIGKANPRTGSVMDNPADIIADIATINGKTLDFPLFRESCNKLGVKVANVVDDADKSLRGHVLTLLDSVGALWVYNNAVFYPSADIGYVKTVANHSPVTYTASLQKRFKRVRIAFNYNHGNDKYSSFLTVEASGSPYLETKTVYCSWLRDSSLALKLGEQLCSYYSGEFASVTTSLPGSVHSGESVALVKAFFSSPVFIKEASHSGASTAIIGETILSSWPITRLYNYTSELVLTNKDSIEVEFQNGVLTITVYDTESKPFLGAFVSLDKGPARKTNSRGRVSFSTVAGAHILDISAPGFVPITDLPIQVS